MSSLEVDIQPSKILAGFIISIHCLACMALWLSAISGVFFWIGIVGLLFHLWWRLGKNKKATYVLKYVDRVWTLTNSDSVRICELVGQAFVTPWVTMFSFKDENGKRESIVLPNDAADADSLRRLRVVLQYDAQ